MRGWQLLEAYVAKNHLQHKPLSAVGIAAANGIQVGTASGWIRDYQRVQKSGRTRLMIRRVPGTRTRNALWVMGTRKLDVEKVARQFADDLTNRFVREIQPTMDQLGVKNLAAQPLATAIGNVVSSHIGMLAATLPDSSPGSP